MSIMKSMDDTLLHSIIEYLYKDVDGHVLSKQARDNLDHDYIGYTYGEIHPHGLKRILEKANPQKHEIFYDLGSGTGKTLITSSIVAPFSKIIGVELFHELHTASQTAVEAYKQKIKPHIPHTAHQEIVTLHADMHSIDFSEADVVFMNSTCFIYDINDSFIQKLAQLKKGARVITTSYYLNNPYFILAHHEELPYSWGNQHTYLQVRT